MMECALLGLGPLGAGVGVGFGFGLGVGVRVRVRTRYFCSRSCPPAKEPWCWRRFDLARYRGDTEEV